MRLFLIQAVAQHDVPGQPILQTVTRGSEMEVAWRPLHWLMGREDMESHVVYITCFHAPLPKHSPIIVPNCKNRGRYSLIVRTGEKEKQFGEQLPSLYHNKFLPTLHNEYVVGLGSKPSDLGPNHQCVCQLVQQNIGVPCQRYSKRWPILFIGI